MGFPISDGSHRASFVPFALVRPAHLMQDNFAYDMIRYDYCSLEPHQDLNLRRRFGHPPPLPPILKSPSVRSIYNHLPFAPNISTPEYILTRTMGLLRALRTYFPRYRLLLSDFFSLPGAIPGVNAPVVRVRVRGLAVAFSAPFRPPELVRHLPDAL